MQRNPIFFMNSQGGGGQTPSPSASVHEHQYCPYNLNSEAKTENEGCANFLGQTSF